MNALGRSRRTRIWSATLLVGVTALLGPTADAGAEPPPPADIAAIAVYVETIPTSTGGVVAGRPPPSPAGSVPARLSAPAAAALEQEGGEEAGLLERVATSPELGAPQRVVPVDDKELEPERTALPAIDFSISDGSSRVPWLVAALALITTALTAVWAARRRAR